MAPSTEEFATISKGLTAWRLWTRFSCVSLSSLNNEFDTAPARLRTYAITPQHNSGPVIRTLYQLIIHEIPSGTSTHNKPMLIMIANLSQVRCRTPRPRPPPYSRPSIQGNKQALSPSTLVQDSLADGPPADFSFGIPVTRPPPRSRRSGRASGP